MAADAARWVDVTAKILGTTSEWSNKVELADINGDGRVDIVFANGGDYDTPGVPVSNRAFLNRFPDVRFEDASDRVFGKARGTTRAIKARDFNGDGRVDLVVANTYQQLLQLYLGDGTGAFRELARTQLPEHLFSAGDVEAGDVDGDGDLDLLVADWGPGNPMDNGGGRTRLWLNDGTAHFKDVTDQHMPDVRVRFSWDLELADVDNDTDLDALVSCKRCQGSFLFENNGQGVFRDVSADRLPRYSNNYDIETMDIDADGDLDLFTVNDAFPFAEHVFVNDGKGVFQVARKAFAYGANPPFCDDNAAIFLDADADADADVLIASLNCPERLLLNDGRGHFQLARDLFAGAPTPGSLGLAVADLDSDARLDVVQSQGEAAFGNRVALGQRMPQDTVVPVIRLLRNDSAHGVVARIHDYQSPSPATFQKVSLHYQVAGREQEASMQCYGEYLWRGSLPTGAVLKRVCAMDAAANRHCVTVAE